MLEAHLGGTVRGTEKLGGSWVRGKVKGRGSAAWLPGLCCLWGSPVDPAAPLFPHGGDYFPPHRGSSCLDPQGQGEWVPRPEVPCASGHGRRRRGLSSEASGKHLASRLWVQLLPQALFFSSSASSPCHSHLHLYLGTQI